MRHTPGFDTTLDGVRLQWSGTTRAVRRPPTWWDRLVLAVVVLGVGLVLLVAESMPGGDLEGVFTGGAALGLAAAATAVLLGLLAVAWEPPGSATIRVTARKDGLHLELQGSRRPVRARRLGGFWPWSEIEEVAARDVEVEDGPDHVELSIRARSGAGRVCRVPEARAAAVDRFVGEAHALRRRSLEGAEEPGEVPEALEQLRKGRSSERIG